MKQKIKKFCLKCGKELNWTGRQYIRKYCSFSCSNSHHDFISMGKTGWTKERRKNFKCHPNNKNRGNHEIKTPEEIEKLRESGRKGGINSAKKQPERSKGEIFLANLFIENKYKVSNSVWDLVQGYEIDIFLPELKTAISYNGPVHREPIYGEIRLEQVKRRDEYRCRKLNEMGIKHIIVEDHGPFNEEKVRKQFEWCIEQIKLT